MMNRRSLLIGASGFGLGLAALARKASADDGPIGDDGGDDGTIPCDEEDDIDQTHPKYSHLQKMYAEGMFYMLSSLSAGYGIIATGLLVKSGGVPTPDVWVALGYAAFYAFLAGVFRHIADDPPRTPYDVHALVYQFDITLMPVFNYLSSAGQSHYSLLAAELARLYALLDVMELGAGADLAGDPVWSDIHSDRAHELLSDLKSSGPATASSIQWAAADMRSRLGTVALASLGGTWADLAASPAAQTFLTDFESWAQPASNPGQRIVSVQLDVVMANYGLPAGTTIGQAMDHVDSLTADIIMKRRDEVYDVHWRCPA